MNSTGVKLAKKVIVQVYMLYHLLLFKQHKCESYSLLSSLHIERDFAESGLFLKNSNLLSSQCHLSIASYLQLYFPYIQVFQALLAFIYACIILFFLFLKFYPSTEVWASGCRKLNQFRYLLSYYCTISQQQQIYIYYEILCSGNPSSFPNYILPSIIYFLPIMHINYYCCRGHKVFVPITIPDMSKALPRIPLLKNGRFESHHCKKREYGKNGH